MTGFFILMTTFFNGCSFGGGDSTTPAITTDERTKIVTTSQGGAAYDFSIKIPREWDIIETKDFTSEVPEEAVVVFRNNIKNEDFTANVSIIRKTLQNPRETLEYAKEVINRQKNGLINYKETKKDLTSIQISGKKVDTYLTYFEAKKDPGSDTVNFIQTYAVKGNSAYSVLGAASPKENANNVKIIEDIVKSFSIK